MTRPTSAEADAVGPGAPAGPVSTAWASPAPPASVRPASGAGAAPPGRPSSTRRGLGLARMLQPGVVPLRPLGIGEVLDGAVATIGRNPRVVLLTSAFVAIPLGLLQLVLDLLLRSGPVKASVGESTSQATQQLGDAVGAQVVRSSLGAVVTGVGVAVLAALLTPMLGRALLGRPSTLGDVARESRRVLPVLAVVALSTLVWAGPLVLGVGLTTLADGFAAITVVGALYALAVGYVAVQLAAPALVMEKLGPGAALRRSWRLVRSAYWRVLVVLALTWLISYVLTAVVRVPIELLADAAGGLSLDSADELSTQTVVLTSLASTVASVLLLPFTALATSLLYLDLRMRKEGLDVALQRTASRE